MSSSIDCILQPPFSCQPQELALDGSRGFAAFLCRQPCPAPSTRAAPQQKTTPRPHVLLIWDLCSSSLDSCQVGPSARAAFSHFKQCLCTHYAGAAAQTVQTMCTGISRSHQQSVARGSAASFAHNSQISEALSFVSTSTAEHDATSPVHSPHHPAHHNLQEAAPQTRASPFHSLHHLAPCLRPEAALQSPCSESDAHHGHVHIFMHAVMPPLRCPEMMPLAAPLPNLLLLQLDVSRLVAGGANEEDGNALPVVKGAERPKRGGEGRLAVIELSADVRASLVATSLALLHRWGIWAEAGVTLKHLLGTRSDGERTHARRHAPSSVLRLWQHGQQCR